MPTYNARTMTARPRLLLDFGAFRQPASPLFRDYLKGSASVRPFFDPPGFGLEALEVGAERTVRLARPREALVGALVAQQQARGAELAARQAERLRDPQAVVVVTGQQAVLFGGPLYVLYKALAAQKAATALEARRGKPVVPVFWVASDDHDFAEIRSVAVLDEAGQIHTLRYEPVREAAGRPASRIILDDTVTALVEELGRTLPASPSREAMLALAQECYRPGVSLADAFARLLSRLLPELVVLDPGDPALKRLMAPVLTREILEASPSSRLASETGAHLLAAGYHQQVPVREGFLNLFLVQDSERRGLGIKDGVIEVRGPGRKLSLAEAAAMATQAPDDWSPGVLLRPLAQDLLLPTAAYVGGPAEIAYHAQIGASYAHFGIPRPALLPRPSLTLIEPAQARALEAEGLGLSDLQAEPEGVIARWAQQACPEVEVAFARTREALEREMGAVEEAVAAVDPTLRAAAEGARGRALHQIATLHEKAIRAVKKRDQVRGERLRRTRDALMPGGAFQERGLGLLGLLARQGPAVVDEIREQMDLWADGHQVVFL